MITEKPANLADIDAVDPKLKYTLRVRTHASGHESIQAVYKSTDTGKMRRRTTSTLDVHEARATVHTWKDVPRHTNSKRSKASKSKAAKRQTSSDNAPEITKPIPANAPKRLVLEGSGPSHALPPVPDRHVSVVAIEPTSDPATLALARAARDFEDDHGHAPTGVELAFFEARGWWGSTGEVERWVKEDRRRGPARDWGLAVLLVLPAALSMGGTATGLGYLLPIPELAWFGATFLSVAAVLFSLGLVGWNRPALRAWAVVGIALVSVVTEFPAIHQAIGGAAEASRASSHAAAMHAEMVARLVAPLVSEADAAHGRAAALVQQSDDERLGRTTGRAGVGPVVKALAEQAATQRTEAERLTRRVAGLAAFVELDDAAGPTDFYDAAVALWARAGGAEAGVERPQRAAFVEDAAESKVLLAWARLAEFDPLALIALLISLGIDGVGIVLGVAVVAPVVSRRPLAVTSASIAAARRLDALRAAAQRVRS